MLRPEIVKGSIVIEDQFLKITIADDGKGMDLAVLNTDSRGIRFMRQRGDLIGAAIAWQSVVEQSNSSGAQGTEVEISINLNGRSGGSNSSN